MRQVTLQLIGILLCVVGSASVSMACTCMPLKGDPARAFTTASAVFSGKVLKITEGESSLPGGPKELAVKFRVEKSWKLIRKDEVMVFTVNTSGLCGFPFTVGESYLVYAGGGDKLFTDICTRTISLMGAKEDLEYLKRKQLLKVKKSKSGALQVSAPTVAKATGWRTITRNRFSFDLPNDMEPTSNHREESGDRSYSNGHGLQIIYWYGQSCIYPIGQSKRKPPHEQVIEIDGMKARFAIDRFEGTDSQIPYICFYPVQGRRTRLSMMAYAHSEQAVETAEKIFKSVKFLN